MYHRTLVFDLDETISDPLTGIVNSVNYSLLAHGYKPVDEDNVRPFIGPPLDYLFQEFTGGVSDEFVASIITKYRERYSSVGYTENMLYENIPEILKELYRRNYRLGICTSKRKDYAIKILKMFVKSKSCINIRNTGAVIASPIVGFETVKSRHCNRSRLLGIY